MKPLLPLLVLLLTGCGSTIGSVNLPAVTAREIHYVRKDTAGGTDIHVTNLDSTSDPTKVKADEIVVVTTYPFINFSLTLRGYERLKTVEEKKP